MVKIAGVVTNSGKKIMIDRTYNSTPTRGVVSEFKVGIGSTAAVASDTDLGHPVPIDNTESIDDCEAKDWTVGAASTVSLNSTTFKEGIYSLNIIKNGISGSTAEVNKTTTSVDLTSKELSIWLYITDATALAKLTESSCIVIKLGSDSTNYFEWRKDRVELSVGWNLLDLLTTTNSDLTEGAPATASLDYSNVMLIAGTTATIWSAGDIMIDDLKAVSSGDYTKTFETDYPVLDYTKLQVTIRNRLSVVQANGYGITEVGVFNTDSTPLMSDRNFFSAMSKSNTDEFIFVVKLNLT